MTKLLLLLFAWISDIDTTTYCNLCSDSNIETHFGVFFSNPRVLQEGYKQAVHGCNSTDVAKQECPSTCFSLNVTSLHIKSRQLLPFGVSYGCSSQVMPESLQKTPSCVRKDLVLRTIPPYVVQAEYCSCRGDSCNQVTVLPMLKKANQYVYQVASFSSQITVLCPLILSLLPR